MSRLWQDIRYGMRMLMQKPGFTAVAVLTLALGIGANTAIFSVVHSVLLEPLPFRDPGRLLLVWNDNRQNGEPRETMSYDNFTDLRAQNTSFDDLAATSPRWSVVLSTDDGPERLMAHYASASLFPLLGVEPLRGRTFLPEEDRPGAPAVALLSYGLWQRRFDGDPGAVGGTTVINNETYTIVGVMPAGFRYLDDIEIWLPLIRNSFISRGRAVRLFTVLGRLKPGVSVEQATTEMTALTARLEQQYPEANTGLGATVVPLQEQIVGETRPALLALAGVVGFVLLIACANVASLLLGRAAARRREMAIRTALGAGRGRLVMQFLTESVLLAIVGGAAGLLLAVWGVELIRAFGPADLPRIQEIAVDRTVLGFTVLVSLLTGVLFGLAPALEAARANPQAALKEGGRTTAGGGSRRLRELLVVCEVALALVLLAGAGLMLRSFVELLHVPTGFDTGRLLTMQIQLPQQRYPDAVRRDAFYRELFERLEALPGVEAAGGATRIPLVGNITTRLEIEGRAVPAGQRPELQFKRVSAHYFRAMGIPVVRGRVFTEADSADAPRAAVISEEAVRRHWPGEDPIGQRIRFFSGDGPWWTIVGVVGDARQFGPAQPAPPEVYMHFSQGPPTAPAVVVRTHGEPATLLPAVRQTIRSLDPEVVVYGTATMDERLAESLSERRFNTWLIALFAALALTLAVVGVYGVLSFLVLHRTHEIGVRMALGARPQDILRMIVGRGLALTAAGVAIGLGGALLLTRYVESLLFGVEPADPLTLGLTALLLTGVALAACWIPARRAMRVDPMVALRYE